jgi:hypothetical protein
MLGRPGSRFGSKMPMRFFWASSSFKELSPKLYVSSMLAGVPKTVLRESDLNTLAWPAYEKRKIHP